MESLLEERLTPLGNRIVFASRPDSNDGAVAQGILSEDEYRLRSIYPLSGWALDIGAHIGTVAIALAVDNPDLRIVAVEALPQNAAVTQENVERNGVADRVFIESAGATDAKTKSVNVIYNYSRVMSDGAEVDPNYLSQCRYIGNIFEGPDQDAETVTVPGISLAAILKKYDIDRVSLLKIDCEGCEWQFLNSRSLSKVDRIVGEYHDRREFSDLVDLVGRTHIVEQWTEGAVGLFGAVRR